MLSRWMCSAYLHQAWLVKESDHTGFTAQQVLFNIQFVFEAGQYQGMKASNKY